jgi:hypothetical protein
MKAQDDFQWNSGFLAIRVPGITGNLSHLESVTKKFKAATKLTVVAFFARLVPL